MADIIFTSSDDFYKRLHDLADTVNREIAERQNNSVEIPLSTSLPAPVSTDNLVNEREAAEREEDEMAAKIKRAITKMKRLDSRLSELAKVRFYHFYSLIFFIIYFSLFLEGERCKETEAFT